MVELRLYPSGFRGSAMVKNTAPIDLEHNRHRMFSSSAITTPEGRSASLDVCRIWEAVTNGAAEAKTFEFHEHVVAVALQAFGAEYLYDWTVAQYKSPNWDEWHQRWIDETLAYAIRGKSRQFSPHNWVALLASPGMDVAMRDSQTVQEIFFERERVGNALTMRQFITLWLQQSGGMDDLTNSLYVLFGSR
jgi:hypothetical protein